MSEHDDNDLDVQPSIEDTICPYIDGWHGEPVAMPSESSADSLTLIPIQMTVPNL